MISMLIGLTVINGLSTSFDEESFKNGFPKKTTSFFRISYGVFHRAAFALSVAWVIFACSNNYGGMFHLILNSKFLFVSFTFCFNLNYRFCKKIFILESIFTS